MKLPLITTGMICFLGICNFAQATVSLDWPPESPDNQYHLNK